MSQFSIKMYAKGKYKMWGFHHFSHENSWVRKDTPPLPPPPPFRPSVPHGLSRMEGLRERDGSRMGTGTGTPFRDKPPPPPPVVSKGWVESGEFNKRATSRQPEGGGGGLSRKGVLSSLLYQPLL